MKVVALAGGFGGARFGRALAESDLELTVIGNVGDDAEILGLHISPDLDSILYAQGLRANEMETEVAVAEAEP